MRKILILIIDFYRIFISPLLPPSCRFYPSCSLYMREAIEKKGVIKGIFLGTKRILRCNPFSAGGYDPLEKEE